MIARDPARASGSYDDGVLGRILRPLTVLALLSALVACRAAAGNGNGSRKGNEVRVLVFTRTAGFHHTSIPQGVAAIRDLGGSAGFAVDSTDDSRRFTLDNLRRYRAVVFLNTTGDVLDEAQQRDFETYVRAGGGYVGVHSATDTEYGWPFYGELVGAWLSNHSEVVPAHLVVEDRTHPATAYLGPTWTRTDEWYNFRTNPRTRVHVLATLDESTYPGGSMGRDHPIAWCHPVGSGRSFYTGGGHTEGSYAEPAFRTHLLGGIRYAAGLVPATCAPSATDQEGWVSASVAQHQDPAGVNGESPAAAATGLSLPGPGEAPDFYFYSGDNSSNTTGRVSKDSAFQVTSCPNGRSGAVE